MKGRKTVLCIMSFILLICIAGCGTKAVKQNTKEGETKAVIQNTEESICSNEEGTKTENAGINSTPENEKPNQVYAATDETTEDTTDDTTYYMVDETTGRIITAKGTENHSATDRIITPYPREHVL